MSAYSDLVLSLSPLAYWRLNESSGGPLDLVGTLAEGTYNNSPTLAQSGLTSDSDTCVDFDGLNQYAQIDGVVAPSAVWNSTGFSIIGWIYAGSDSRWQKLLTWASTTPGNAKLAHFGFTSANKLRAQVQSAGATYVYADSDAAVDLLSGPVFLCAVFNAGALTLYVDGSAVAATTSTSGTITAMPDDDQFEQDEWYIGSTADPAHYFDGLIDDVAVFTTALTAQNIADIFAEAGPAGPASLPVSLYGTIQTSAASLPLNLNSPAENAAQSLSTRLEGPQPAHYQGTTPRWGLIVTIGGADVSDRLIGQATVNHEEGSSGVCRVLFDPASGSIDPDDYERKTVTVTFVGKDAAGATLYTARRFTGVTTIAQYDPETATMSIAATTDIQGRLEQLPREAIDNLVGGSWSEHVFAEENDGWQYAQDRLSTVPKEIHANQYGQIEVSDWAAKVTADYTFTDAERFNGTLSYQRASRRELLSQVVVEMDFRFSRLRHREMNVIFVNSLGFCGYLNGEGQLASKNTVLSAANSSSWTRISDITFTDLPAPGTYCSPSRGWVGDPLGSYCLGASWLAARRWAQTITEEYAITIRSPDIEEAIGQQTTSLSYGIESTYDSDDYERITDFSGAPNGAVLSPKTNDYQIDATDDERNGRLEMEAAQTVAIEKARTMVLERARKNTVSFEPEYTPGLFLDHTVSINTPYLVAKGKVAAIGESYDVNSQQPKMVAVVALSRHGGSGSGTDTPVEAAAKPEQAEEEPTARSYYLQHRSGGTTGAIPDDPDWDGWITNAFGAAQTDPTTRYRERFSIRMPEIEQVARASTSAQQAVEFTVAVPQDTFTMSR